MIIVFTSAWGSSGTGALGSTTTIELPMPPEGLLLLGELVEPPIVFHRWDWHPNTSLRLSLVVRGSLWGSWPSSERPGGSDECSALEGRGSLSWSQVFTPLAWPHG